MVNINLLTERKRLGLTTQQAADRLGVHQNTYINWEQGNCIPTGDNLINLVHLFGGTAEYLMGMAKNRDETSIVGKAER